MPLRRAGLYWRTLRHLRARQAWHLAQRLIRPSTRPRPAVGRWDSRTGPAVVGAIAALGPVDTAPHATRSAAAWAAGRLTWLGLDVPWTGDWTMQGPSPLWRYHLHYHEHLADAAWLAASRNDTGLAAQVATDVRAWNGHWADGGAPAWDAYPTAVRLVSWLRILGSLGATLPQEDAAALREGIATHTEWLGQNLEWHLEGNHILRDAWALALGAACLSVSSVSRAEAKALFERLMHEQVHADGWHEERSPMYHARALRDALEVQAAFSAIGDSLSTETRERIHAMRDALGWMLRADGSIWQLNDSALDLGVDLGPLRLPNAPIEGVRWFRDARAVVVADPCGDRLRLDLGSPAPAHQPGHAHSGALGFECDIAGLPLVVDGGVAGYDGDPWRPWLRGTAAHSTVRIDERDQNEHWATFRIGGRAHTFVERVEGSAAAFSAAATCRPYHSAATHRRQFLRTGREIRLEDQVTGAQGRVVEAFLHFAPEWNVAAAGEQRFVASRDGVRVVIAFESAAAVSLHHGDREPLLGWRARGFNDVRPAFAIRLRSASYSGRPWYTTIAPV